MVKLSTLGPHLVTFDTSNTVFTVPVNQGFTGYQKPYPENYQTLQLWSNTLQQEPHKRAANGLLTSNTADKYCESPRKGSGACFNIQLTNQ